MCLTYKIFLATPLEQTLGLAFCSYNPLGPYPIKLIINNNWGEPHCISMCVLQLCQVSANQVTIIYLQFFGIKIYNTIIRSTVPYHTACIYSVAQCNIVVLHPSLASVRLTIII